MGKQSIPASSIAIAHMALKEAVPGLTPESLEEAVRFVQSKGKLQDNGGLLKGKDAAKLLAVSRRSFDRLVASGRVEKVVITPPHARKDGREIGGCTRYRVSDLQAFINGRGRK